MPRCQSSLYCQPGSDPPPKALSGRPNLPDPNDPGRRAPEQPDDEGLDQRLDALHKRLEKVQGARVEPTVSSKPSNAALGMAFRIATEFVVGLLVGGMIGWQIDQLAGTQPWFMVVFFMLGAAAAFLNVIRLADRMHNDHKAAGETEPQAAAGRHSPEETGIVATGGTTSEGGAATGGADNGERKRG
ncbi:MAG: AtpZ/AtpI family protein [Pseudomonadota bacterium]